jgi:hypothetical protein
MKPSPPPSNVRINIHKKVPIRPVGSNILVLAYQRAKYLSVKEVTSQLCHKFITYDSTQLAHNFNNFKINASSRLITPRIKIFIGIYQLS